MTISLVLTLDSVLLLVKFAFTLDVSAAMAIPGPDLWLRFTKTTGFFAHGLLFSQFSPVLYIHI